MRRLTPWEQLHTLVGKWEYSRRGDTRNRDPYGAVLDELLFHGELRFGDYVQYQNEGEFETKLWEWLGNVNEEHEQKALLMLLHYLFFVDRLQMQALYRDAYRRIIAPWVSRGMLEVSEMLAPDYDGRLKEELQKYALFHITESFHGPGFLSANDLHGIPRLQMLGRDPDMVPAMIQSSLQRTGISGAVVFEDFVGSGNQAYRILRAFASNVPDNWRLLFLPLIALDKADERFAHVETSDPVSAFAVKPVIVIPRSQCLCERRTQGEPEAFSDGRAVVRSSRHKVLQHDGAFDDPPSDPFGYQGCGALVVTCHNVPNNTLPLFHHRSPEWHALFRRLHHG